MACYNSSIYHFRYLTSIYIYRRTYTHNCSYDFLNINISLIITETFYSPLQI